MSKIKIEISVMLIKAVFMGFILLILIKKTNRITNPKKILFVLKKSEDFALKKSK